MTNQPSFKEVVDAALEGVLEPAKDPAVRRMDRYLQIVFGVILFLLAGAFGFAMALALIQGLLRGELPKGSWSALVIACGGIACSVVGIRLIFNIQGRSKYLFSVKMLWAFALFFSLFTAMAYVFWGEVPPRKPLIGTILIVSGCAVLAIKRGRAQVEQKGKEP